MSSRTRFPRTLFATLAFAGGVLSFILATACRPDGTPGEAEGAAARGPTADAGPSAAPESTPVEAARPLGPAIEVPDSVARDAEAPSPAEPDDAGEDRIATLPGIGAAAPEEGLGGLIGAKGTAVGAGGLASRGTGLGGGGTAEGLGGLGTRGSVGSLSAGSASYGAGAAGGGASGSGSGRGVVILGRSGGAAGGIQYEQRQVSRPSTPPPLPRINASGGEEFTDYGVGEVVLAEVDNLSTFAVDVDTGSYTLARSTLHASRLPMPGSVRLEEFVNYFDYDYVGPTADAPFAVNMEAAPNPWVDGHHVLRVGIQGRRVRAADRKPARLVFLVDVSGSMRGSGRLDLAKESLHHLVDQLGAEDSVGIVTYAGSTQRVLAPTSAVHASVIHRAIDGLRAGGSTAMGSGIRMAYDMAREGFVDGAENRVVVLSDGDANVGATSHEQLLELIGAQARDGITLSTVGFGRGNYRDTLMEQLADQGDGNYAYVDSIDEGERVFGQRIAGTIETIARDVKIQVELNPRAVIAWRLLGYENRDVADEDFRDDAVDGGEIGSGHSVTALYDVVLKDGWSSRELATVHLRAKPPGRDAPAEEWQTVFKPRLLKRELADTSDSFRLALGAATFAELLRGSPHVEELRYADAWEMVQGAARADHPEDAGLLELIETAGRLAGEEGVVATR